MYFKNFPDLQQKFWDSQKVSIVVDKIWKDKK